MPRERHAELYDALPLPHRRRGGRTPGRLPLPGRGRMPGLGRGTGGDTVALLDPLPEGRVVAVDGPQQMLRQQRSRLAGRLDLVAVVHADLVTTSRPRIAGRPARRGSAAPPRDARATRR